MQSRHENNDIALENPLQPVPAEEPGNNHQIRFHYESDIDDDLEMNRDRNVLAPPRNPSGPVNLDDIFTLQRQIQESKIPLETELRRISGDKQIKYSTIYLVAFGAVGISVLLGGAIAKNDPIVLIGDGIAAHAVLLSMVSVFSSHLCGKPLPLYQLPCIKYPILYDLLLSIREKNAIITTMRDAHTYFPSIPTVSGDEDAAAVLRKLNFAIKEIDQEMKVNAKKRGKEVLNVLKKVGVFSRNYGPVQLTILEYMIPDESIVQSLAVPLPKKARSR